MRTQNSDAFTHLFGASSYSRVPRLWLTFMDVSNPRWRELVRSYTGAKHTAPFLSIRSANYLEYPRLPPRGPWEESGKSRPVPHSRAWRKSFPRIKYDSARLVQRCQVGRWRLYNRSRSPRLGGPSTITVNGDLAPHYGSWNDIFKLTYGSSSHHPWSSSTHCQSSAGHVLCNT